MASDTDVMSVSDITDTEEPVRRGRGRPESTGQYRVRKAKDEARIIRREAAELQEVLDPSVPARPRGRGAEPPEGIANVRTSAVPTLRNIIEEELARIGKLAGNSRNLKGGYVKVLRDSAALIAASAEALVERAAASVAEVPGGSPIPRAGMSTSEAERMRAELDELRRENVRLRGEVEAQTKRLDEALAEKLAAASITTGPAEWAGRRRTAAAAAKPTILPSSGSEGDCPPPGPSRPMTEAMEVETPVSPVVPHIPPPSPPARTVEGGGTNEGIPLPRTAEELTTLIARVVSSVLEQREARQVTPAPSKLPPTGKAPGNGGRKDGDKPKDGNNNKAKGRDSGLAAAAPPKPKKKSGGAKTAPPPGHRGLEAGRRLPHPRDNSWRGEGKPGRR